MILSIVLPCTYADSQQCTNASPLVAIFEPIGEANAYGSATIRYNSDHSFLVTLDVDDVDQGCSGPCLVKLAQQTTCNASNFTSYYDTNHLSADPWVKATSFWSTVYDFSKSAFRVNNGYSSMHNDGHALVMYDSNDQPMACGILKMTPGIKLKAEMGPYPGSSTELTVGGVVEVIYKFDGTFRFKYNLQGLRPNCTDCGIHIHAGVSCETHEQVKGHGWNQRFVQDLWTTAGGATYNSNQAGEAKGYFHIFNGFNVFVNNEHAVVVHTQDGSRIACAQLKFE